VIGHVWLPLAGRMGQVVGAIKGHLGVFEKYTDVNRKLDPLERAEELSKRLSSPKTTKVFSKCVGQVKQTRYSLPSVKGDSAFGRQYVTAIEFPLEVFLERAASLLHSRSSSRPSSRLNPFLIEYSGTNATRVVFEESSSIGTGGSVWLPSVVMWWWLLEDQKSPYGPVSSAVGHLEKHRHVLELGSGLGVVGVALASFGFECVTLTDIEKQLPLMKSNVELNVADLTTVRFASHVWGSGEFVLFEEVNNNDSGDGSGGPDGRKGSGVRGIRHDEFLESEAKGDSAERRRLNLSSDPPSLVVGCDILYNPRAYDDLLTTLRMVNDLHRSNKSRFCAVLVYEERLREDEASFFERCGEFSSVEHIPLPSKLVPKQPIRITRLFVDHGV